MDQQQKMEPDLAPGLLRGRKADQPGFDPYPGLARALELEELGLMKLSSPQEDQEQKFGAQV